MEDLVVRLRSLQTEGTESPFYFVQECGEAAEELEKLRALLLEAAEDIEHWGGYASEYFQNKWNLAGDIAKYRAAAGPAPAED